ncbi:MAG: hypothetical protein ACO3YO_01785 [Chthoniobacterales bacterium]
MDTEYVKSVVKGLSVAHVCLGLAAAGGLVTVIAVGWTQWPFLVAWVPAILTAVFLVVTTVLLQRDVVAQRQASKKND